jgi:hypothetical protein
LILTPLASATSTVLVPGNFARVTVEYLAENRGELHVAVIGHDQKHSIKEIIEHVFH